MISELTALTTRCGAALQIDLEQEQQTSVIQLVGGERTDFIPLPPPTVATRTRRLRTAR